MAKKALLTERQVAMIAEGVDPQAAIELAPETPVTPEVPEIEAKAAETQEDAPTETVVAILPQTPSNAPPVPELVAYLQTELAAKSAEITQQAVHLAAVEQELNGFRAHHDSMKSIVANSINRMSLGLYGKTLPGLEALPVEALLLQHSQVATAFGQQFPVGGVVHQTIEAPEVKAHDPMVKARLRAVKSTK